MYFAEVMERSEMTTQTSGNGPQFTGNQPVIRRKDPSPVIQALMVLVFAGLLIVFTVLSAMSTNTAKSKTRSNPRQMPMIHMDR